MCKYAILEANHHEDLEVSDFKDIEDLEATELYGFRYVVNLKF